MLHRGEQMLRGAVSAQFGEGPTTTISGTPSGGERGHGPARQPVERREIFSHRAGEDGPLFGRSSRAVASAAASISLVLRLSCSSASRGVAGHVLAVFAGLIRKLCLPAGWTPDGGRGEPRAKSPQSRSSLRCPRRRNPAAEARAPGHGWRKQRLSRNAGAGSNATGAQLLQPTGSRRGRPWRRRGSQWPVQPADASEGDERRGSPLLVALREAACNSGSSTRRYVL